MAWLLKFDKVEYSICLTSSLPEEWLCILEFRQNEGNQHLLHFVFHGLLVHYFVSESSDCVHKRLFNSPIWILTRSYHFVILSEILNRPLNIPKKIIWLRINTFTFFRFLWFFTWVFAEILKEVLNLIFGLQHSLGEIVLTANILYWLIREGLYILFWDEHDWYDDVLEDIFHIWLDLVHGNLLLSRGRCKFDCKIQRFWTYKLGFLGEENLHVWSQESHGILGPEFLTKFLDNIFLFDDSRITILNKYSVSDFRGYSLNLPENVFIFCDHFWCYSGMRAKFWWTLHI